MMYPAYHSYNFYGLKELLYLFLKSVIPIGWRYKYRQQEVNLL